MKPIVPRERADRDVDEAIGYYAKEAPHVVDDLIDAFESSYNAIGDAPQTGSLRYATSRDTPGPTIHAARTLPLRYFLHRTHALH